MSEEPGQALQVVQRERLESEQALQRAARDGIHRLQISTPFKIGRVNAYLIEDRPLTLIDSGPNSATSLDELERALAEHGHAVEDLELLIVSHQHMDHFGLASILARRSGAEVAAISGLDGYLEGFAGQAELDDSYAELMMLRHGIPPDVAAALRSVSMSFRAWGADVQVTRTLHDGERLELAERTLQVLHRPGHSPSDTLFWDESRALLFAADHLIKNVSSNPLLTRPVGVPPDASGPRPQALVAYMESMRATAAMNPDLVLSGHGDPITDHRALIEHRLGMHDQRAQKIRKMIIESPRTAHAIAQEMWGNVAVTQAYLTLSEVLGHVDLLVNAGQVVEVERAGVVTLRAL